MKSYIHLGSKKIDFTLIYMNRKSLGITVTPEMEVIVKAPLAADKELIHQKVHKRAAWIIKQQSFFLGYLPKSTLKKFVSGESHLYLGRSYKLKILKADVNTVKVKGRIIEVKTSDKTLVKSLLENWYSNKANEQFEKIAKPCIERFKKYHVSPDSIVLREMPKRWGSCTPKGKIILNKELIKAPKGCIEYVIIHELCHLVHHNHTSKFLALQSKEMKDWAKWKERLEKILA